MSRRWYEQYPYHFVFKEKIKLHARIHCIEPFPKLWSSDSNMKFVWGRTQLFDPELSHRLRSSSPDLQKWKEMTELFKDTLVVADDQRVYIMWPSRPPIQIKLHELSQGQLIPTDKVNVAWALNPDKPYEPMVIFSYNKIIYIFNARAEVLEGRLRGHGGEITSIAVHPYAAHIFCTTSRDFTSRLYDLTRKPQLKPNNPHWPPSQTPSLAASAHGLDMAFEEGRGIGRCVLVLMGCRSGGHWADVLGAAFNDSYPVIATCGMDRTIKIWHIPYFSNRADQQLLQRDKPLFSSSMIHRARVISVQWLSSDLLLSHSAPARMPVIIEPSEPGKTSKKSMKFEQDEPGSLALWKWLSIDRFFPPGWDNVNSLPKGLPASRSDYQESTSFRILSNYFFPPQTEEHTAPTLYLHSGDPVPFVIYSHPNSRTLTIVNITLLEPYPPHSLTLPPNGMNLRNLWRQINQIQGWDLTLDDSLSGEETIETCIMTSGARTIIAGGSEGSLWFFVSKSS